MNKRFRILIADDHPLFTTGVRSLLAEQPDFEVVGAVSNADDACCEAARLRPDLLLLDLFMPGCSPAEVVQVVREQSPATKVLIVSAFNDAGIVQGLSALGIDGYLLKDEKPEMLTRAIRSILRGAAWFSQPVYESLASLRGGSPDPAALRPRLNERERAILAAIGRGWSTRQIAQHFNLAIQTVRNYTSALYHKLGVRSRAQALVWLRSENGHNGSVSEDA